MIDKIKDHSFGMDNNSTFGYFAYFDTENMAILLMNNQYMLEVAAD